MTEFNMSQALVTAVENQRNAALSALAEEQAKIAYFSTVIDVLKQEIEKRDETINSLNTHIEEIKVININSRVKKKG